MQEKICIVCHEKILKGQPSFNFPYMPKPHQFYDVSGLVFHTNCIRKLNSERNFGSELAHIYEKMAANTEYPTSIYRNGDIVIQIFYEEKVVEFMDYEDFVEFSLPVHSLELIDSMKPFDQLNYRMTSLCVLQDGEIQLVTYYYKIVLPCLSLTRLKEIAKYISQNFEV